MFKKVAKKAFGKKTSPLNNYQFNIDVVSPGVISGWALNKKQPEHKPVIDVYSGDKILWQTKAENTREDLTANNIGSFGFHLVPIPDVLIENISEVDVYIDGHKVNEKPFICEILKPEPVIVEQIVPATEAVTQEIPVEVEKAQPQENTDVVFHLDICNDKFISGWGKSKSDDNKRLLVEFYYQGKAILSGVADSYRKDLHKAKIGDGKYGFKCSFDLAQFPSEHFEVDVFVNGQALIMDSVVINVDTKDLAEAKYKAEFGEQLAEFEQNVTLELTRMTDQVNQIAEDLGENNLNIAANVALQNIAELSTRVGNIEKILTKHFASKNSN